MSTSPVPTPYQEPWLRGTHTEVPAVGRAVLHALDLALDDLARWTAGLTDAEIHSQPLGLTSVAFHLRHIARSDRPASSLTPKAASYPTEQLAALKAESFGDESLAGLLLARLRPLSTTQQNGCASWPQPTSTLHEPWAASSCQPRSAAR